MNSFLDDALVGLVLLVSAAYALSALGPRGLRRRLLSALGALLRRAPVALRLSRAAQQIVAAAESKPKGACGGCDDCASEKPASGAAAEIKVPIANIGRTRTSRLG